VGVKREHFILSENLQDQRPLSPPPSLRNHPHRHVPTEEQHDQHLSIPVFIKIMKFILLSTNATCVH
jgi:hypothetical protein